jgi:hypothetical protein
MRLNQVSDEGKADQVMKRIHIIGISLIAIFAFSVVAAASASAAITVLLAEWLVNGTGVATTLNVTSTGELLLEDEKVSLLFGAKAMVLCSGILDGTIGANGVDEVLELLNLAGAAISLTALTGTSLSCTNQENCESSKVWAVKLPWKTLLELVEELGFVGFADLTEGTPGWYVECTALGIKLEDECTALQDISEKVNVAGGVEDVSSDAFTLLVEGKKGKCTRGEGEETEILEGTASNTIAGATLQVSSE